MHVHVSRADGLVLGNQLQGSFLQKSNFLSYRLQREDSQSIDLPAGGALATTTQKSKSILTDVH